MGKKIKVIFFIYLAQFLTTSCLDCGCPTIATYERKLVGLTVEAWDTSGFAPKKVEEDTVYKNAFGITATIQDSQRKVAYGTPPIRVELPGFTPAMACSCPPPKYIDLDTIDAITVSVVDGNSQEKEVIEVTDDFFIIGLSGQRISIPELVKSMYERLKNNHEWHYSVLQFYLTTYEDIPDIATFTIDVRLRSGVKLTARTQRISFSST